MIFVKQQLRTDRTGRHADVAMIDGRFPDQLRWSETDQDERVRYKRNTLATASLQDDLGILTDNLLAARSLSRNVLLHTDCSAAPVAIRSIGTCSSRSVARGYPPSRPTSAPFECRQLPC